MCTLNFHSLENAKISSETINEVIHLFLFLFLISQTLDFLFSHTGEKKKSILKAHD